MNQLSASNTPLIVDKKGDLTTGSQLLDSFVVGKRASSTVYLLPELFRSSLVANSTDTQTYLNASSVQIGLDSLSSATAPTSRQVEPSKADELAEELSLRSDVEASGSKETTGEETVSKALAVEETVAREKSDDEEAARQKIGSQEIGSQETTGDRSEQVMGESSKRLVAQTARQNIVDRKPDISKVLAPTVSKVSAPKKKIPNPSLERAAAVGMLDLSDKLLFGGEDDTFADTYLENKDPLTGGGDGTAVLKYLSKQITESKVAKIRGRLPLSTRPQSEMLPSKVVLDARNFQVVKPSSQKTISEASEGGSKDAQKDQTLDAISMSEQIALLNQKVELLTRELSNLATTASKPGRSNSDEAA